MKTLIFDLDGTLVQLKPNLICFANVHHFKLLREQYNFALVSGSTKEEVEYALTEMGLRPLFDDIYIVAFEDTNSEKATGKPFIEMQKRLQGEMVMIGDSESDEIGAKLAGIPFVKVWNYTDTDQQRKELEIAMDRAIILVDPKYKN